VGIAPKCSLFASQPPIARIAFVAGGLARYARLVAWMGISLFATQQALHAQSALPSGLFMHLDAASLEQERQAKGLASLSSGDPVDVWLDRSGNGNHFRSASEEGRPQWHAMKSGNTIRFDGVDDALRCLSATRKEMGAGTVWMVVAPHANPGDFRGLFACNASGERDYTSGLNVDLGPGPSARWDMINVEGRGFSGARNMARSPLPFGTLRILELQWNSSTREVRLQVDGQPAGTRPMESDSIAIEEWTLGARYYTNGPGEQKIRGSFAGDVAEFMVFDRCLSREESLAMGAMLDSKYQALRDELPSTIPQHSESEPLVRYENPPPVQFLVPGFHVRELPVALTNVNNVRYRDDATMVTLGYNGDIHLLRDRDGDGLEEEVQIFYKNKGSLIGPIGMQLTPIRYAGGAGVFVACKGKVVLIQDQDGDDVADHEITVAQGWDPLPVNVDAVGLAIGPDGSIYFGLGTADYSNAYLVDDSGKARYDLKGEHGTIQKVSPDFSHRETVCTGVRFPIGMAFHRNGDLFCTDQEGATWLPNGNPFDELLLVQPGRHYGFPPRHPQHNPSVLDEPSVFDYAPQHQSTCGLFFNGNADDPSRFGPVTWAGDAMVCGESRGKLWRTRLCPSESGYVAQTQLIAALQMLTVDACTSPSGDLIVACHSGPPDWGTGPEGMGHLFKITASREPVPRPSLAWFASPSEICVALDAPIDPARWPATREDIHIDAGAYVRAGDRYENLVPPYAVVQAQSLVPRRQVPVLGFGLSPDLRTIHIQVPPQSLDEHYAIRMPAPHPPDPLADEIAQRNEMEIDCSMEGVRAEWVPMDPSQASWIGWLPHVDLRVARDLTRGSASHDTLWLSMQAAGTLKLQTHLDLKDILRPKIQPGATIDYDWPEELVTVTLGGIDGVQGAVGMECLSGKAFTATSSQNPSSDAPSLVVGPEGGIGPKVALQLSHSKPSGDANVTIRMHTNEDPSPRALPLHRMRLTWASDIKTDPNLGSNLNVAELEGGNWGRGRRIFQGEQARCSQCHAEPGTGAKSKIGPDLSNLIFRDYASVIRDITHPSYAINPEYIGHHVRLNDGTILTGVVREEQGRWTVGDALGKTTELSRDAIEEMKTSSKSVMPEGLLEKLSKEQVRDLMTYLLTSPPRMPLESPHQAPKLRTAAQVAEILAGSTEPTEPYRHLKIVLVAGPKDHGPNEHDYPAWLMQWGQLLAAGESVHVEAAWEFPNPSQIAEADVLIFFQKGSWNPDRARQMDAFFERGGGAVYLHWAVNGDDQVVGFSERIGLASWGGKIKYRHGPLTLQVADPTHPILRNVRELELLDESYWLLTGDLQKIGLLATSLEDGEAQPQLWTHERGNGRVFVSIPGHYSWTFDDPIFRIVLLRGMAWVMREPIDRFNELVPLGARITR
jgi:putative heme-binding domain-containing protein